MPCLSLSRSHLKHEALPRQFVLIIHLLFQQRLHLTAGGAQVNLHMNTAFLAPYSVSVF